MPETAEETQEIPKEEGQIKITYLGPVSPHWEFKSVKGDKKTLEEFETRTLARLLLLPPHDPQFRRNRERVNRDGERYNILIDWDLGYEEE